MDSRAKEASLREELAKIQLEFSKKEQEATLNNGSEKAIMSRKLEMKEMELEVTKNELKTLRDEKVSIASDLESTQKQAFQLVQNIQVENFYCYFYLLFS